jgi:hypothetical protein
MNTARPNLPPNYIIAFVASGLTLALGLGIRAYMKAAKLDKLKEITAQGPSDWESTVRDTARRALTWSDYDGNCTGYAGSIFRSLGFNLRGDVKFMADQAKRAGAFHNGPPRVGDLVFFHNTWDKNKNGLLDDWWTHIGVVMDVSPTGRVTFGHGGTSGGRAIGYLSVTDPNTYKDASGLIINGYLRAKKTMDLLGTKYLTGQLVAGYATLRPEDKDKWNVA